MKKSKKPAKTVVRQRRFSMTTLIIAAVVIAAAAITVASKQLASSKVTNTQTTNPVAATTDKKYVTVKVAGREVQVDPQTGKIKPLSPQEAKQLADGLKTMLNKSTEGLEPVQNADGSVSLDLKGRFQNVAIARVNDDGSVEQSCIDEPQQAAQFFGIDPKLLSSDTSKGVAQPIIKTPARKAAQ